MIWHCSLQTWMTANKLHDKSCTILAAYYYQMMIFFQQRFQAIHRYQMTSKRAQTLNQALGRSDQLLIYCSLFKPHKHFAVGRTKCRAAIASSCTNLRWNPDSTLPLSLAVIFESVSSYHLHCCASTAGMKMKCIACWRKDHKLGKLITFPRLNNCKNPRIDTTWGIT